MSTHPAPFASSALRFAACAAAVFLPLACTDSTEPTATPARYLVTTSFSNPIAGDSVVLKAQLVDADDNPVRLSGRVVTWTSDAGRGRLNTAATLTGADGTASTIYVTDTIAGVVNKVVASDLNGIRGISPDIVPIAGAPVRYNVTPSSFSPTVGTEILISAQLADVYGNPTKFLERRVTWSTSYSEAGTFSSPTSLTDANGLATTKLTISGRSNIEFYIDVLDDRQAHGASKPLTAQAGPLAKYIVLASAIDPPAGADVLVYAEASDAYGNPVAAGGKVIAWTKTGSGGSLSAQATTTDENGFATVVLTTASVVGIAYTVSASDAGGLSGTSENIITQQQVSLESVAAGFGASSSCGIASDGKAWCWGANDVGGLGNGTYVDRPLPGKISGSQTMTSLSAGFAHACGIAAGVVLCWGNNRFGQLGDNTSVASRATPAPINSSLSFTAVSAGTDHTCAIATGGDAYCWGLRATNRLGDGGLSTSSSSPVKVAGGLTFVAISAGVDHTCGITTSGDAYCWGANNYGKLGDNSATPAALPRAVQGGLKFTSIAVGETHTCGISAGTAYCWGDGRFSQIGSTLSERHLPTPVGGGITFVQISAGGFNTCGIASDARAYCWGDNHSGQLANATGSSFGSAAPLVVPGGLTFKSISVGGGMVADDYYYYYSSSTPAGHACGVTLSGVTYCWGSNARGELGLGHYTSTATPTKLAGQP